MRLWEHFDEIDISRNISKAIIFVVGAPLVEEQTGSEIDPRGVIFQYACYTVRTSYSAMLYNIHIYPHHRLDLAPRIYQTPTSMRHDFFALPPPPPNFLKNAALPTPVIRLKGFT